MISDKDLPELAEYRRLENELPISWVPLLGPLVVSTGNETLPIHRWFKYKESYSGGLLENLFTLAKLSPTLQIRLLDPYCGVGTTLLSAQTRPTAIASAVGIERNPLAAFVARSKLSWPLVNTDELQKISSAALKLSETLSAPLPELSSIRTGRCITRHIAGRLLSIRDALLKFPKSPSRDVLLVGLASAVEPLSRVRKDGRALRLVARSNQRVVPELLRKWSEILADVKQMQAAHTQLSLVEVRDGDGRRPLDSGLEASSVDVVLTSPPYPNNIDYSEVYKLELWLMGFITSGEQFLRLRKSTLRSHPTSDLITAADPDFQDAIRRGILRRFFDPLVIRTTDHTEKWRAALALGYFSDIWVSLREQYKCLRPGGRSLLVLGNSLHGCAGNAYLIPTDLLVAQLARRIGFHLESIFVARNTKRRLSGNHFLRESIVVVRKPKDA